MCLSCPQFTPQVEGQLRKNFGTSNALKNIGYMLTALTLLHQKGALSYEISYGTNPELNKRVPPDISRTNQPIIINPFQTVNDIKHAAFNNANDASKVHMWKFLKHLLMLPQVKLQ